ncbi:MAG: glycosyltransferase [Symploca sp. SIO1C2]|nr:glycosyltransferase [Symploca sp. SIO1C2]
MTLLPLLVWIILGIALRFGNLALKSPWTDEFATMVFSLGNSYNLVPLNQVISLDNLLEPLKPNAVAVPSALLHHLLNEDHHPPLYFLLAHWWTQLFPPVGDYVSLWAMRSLPAFLGVLSIPGVYGLSWLAFRSQLVAQLTAAIMAVSPYGIFLAQEARHYTLGILWVIASLSCLVVALQHLHHKKPLPLSVTLGWIVVNSLGMATHYFFSLTLCAEAIALAGFWILRNSQTSPSQWWRIGSVAAGTFVGSIVWFPVWQASRDPEMIQWVMSSDRNIWTILNPIFQSLAAWITMLFLLPVEVSAKLVSITSGVVMLLFFIWLVPILYRGIKTQLRQSDHRLATGILGGFVLGAIALFFGITYFIGVDLTRGARYNFVYFPAVIVLVGAVLALSWQEEGEKGDKGDEEDKEDKEDKGDEEDKEDKEDKVISKYISHSQFPIPNSPFLIPHSQKTITNVPSPKKKRHIFSTKGKRTVAIIWLMGFFSSLTVINNLGYQKYYRPDLLVSIMQQQSSVPLLIATTHNTLVQTGEIMGIGWEFQQAANLSGLPINPQFFLAHQEEDQCVSLRKQGKNCSAFTTLQQALAQLPRPLDLWLVNFKAPVDELPTCVAQEAIQSQISVDGYLTQLYRCLE